MERPFAPLLLDALAASAVLAGIAFAVVAVLGIVLGVVAAVHQNRWIDHAVSVFTYLWISVPEFFWGIVLIFTHLFAWVAIQTDNGVDMSYTIER